MFYLTTHSTHFYLRLYGVGLKNIYFILYCIVLYCIVLYILYYIILYYIILYYVIIYYIILYYIILYYIIFTGFNVPVSNNVLGHKISF